MAANLRQAFKESEERRMKSEETAFGGRRESQFNSLSNHKVQSSNLKVQSKKGSQGKYKLARLPFISFI